MHHARRRRAGPFVALACLAVLAACGTRLPDEAFVEARSPEGEALGPAAEGATVTTAARRASTSSTVAGGGPTATVPGGGPAPEGGPDPGGGEQAGPTGPNQASDVGVTETTIRLGTIVAENGVLGDAFAPVARGVRAWAEHVNANGGIHGRQVELFTCDDREDRARSLQCAQRLVEQDQVFALVATNTRAFGGAASYLAERRIPTFGIPITNSGYRWNSIFPIYGAPYRRDGQTVGHEDQLRSLSGGYRWFREQFGVTKAAVFAYDIAESAQAGRFIAQGLELEGFEVEQYTVSFAAPSFDQPVADMQRRGTEIVFDAMDDGANRRLCDTMARRGYQPTAKVSTIVAMGQSLGEEFNEACRNVSFITGSSVAYTQTDVPVIAEFREAFDRYQRGQELHQWALEGFLLGEIVAELVAGPAPTREGVIAAMNQRAAPFVFRDVLTVDGYGPADFDADRAEDCFTVARWLDAEGGWVEATDAFPFCYPDAFQYFTPVAERGD